MFKILLVAAILVATQTHAQSVNDILKGAEIKLGTTTFVGYILTSSYDVIDPAKPDALGRVKEVGREYLPVVSQAVLIKFPEEMVVSTGKAHQRLNAEEITEIRAKPGPLEGKAGWHASYLSFEPRVVKLLNTKPLFSCKLYLYEEATVYWLSYDPKIGAKELQPFCDKEKSNRPSAENEQAILKNQNVLKIYLSEG